MIATLGGEHAELLSQVELFRGLDRVTLAKLVGHLEPVPVQAGEIIFRQGDPPDGLYLVSRGSVAISVSDAAGTSPTVLNTLRRGEAFGEIALLTGDVRTATAQAEEDGELLRLHQKRFQELVRRDSSVSLAISAGLIRRLRTADAARQGLASTAPEGPLAPPTTSVSSSTQPRLSTRRMAGMGLAILILCGGWLLPSPSNLDPRGWHTLISLLAIVPVLALESLPDGATALLLVVVWVLGDVAAPRIALSGFSTTTWILTVAVFAIGAAVAASGLLYRVALWAVARAAGFRRQVLALGLSGLVLGAGIPNATGRMSLMSSAVAELSEALGYEATSPQAVGLAMAAYVGYGAIVAAFLTSSSTGLLSLAILPEASRARMDFVTWALAAAPLHVVLLVGLLGMIVWRSAPRDDHRATLRSSAALRVQQTLLGRVSKHEGLAGLVIVLMLLGFSTQPLHGIDPAFVAILAFVVLAATGLLTLATLQAVNWNSVLLLGVLASMTQVVSTTKLDVWISSVLVGVLGGLAAAPVLFVVALTLLGFALSLVLRWQAAVPVVVLALAPVAQGAGIDPWIVAIVALTATNTFFLPYQSTIYLAFFSGGGARMLTHAQARPYAYAYAALTLLGLIASVPVWHAMGLL